MSATYTLHLGRDGPAAGAGALDGADLVRDGFSWGAFLAPALWFAALGHWLLAFGALGAVAALALALWAAGAGAATILAAEIVLHLLIGFEGPSLRRWSYGRRGRPAVDVVHAASSAEAETKSFARWLAPSVVEPRSGLDSRRAFVRPASEPVIGLFPDLEGRR